MPCRRVEQRIPAGVPQPCGFQGAGFAPKGTGRFHALDWKELANKTYLFLNG